MADISSSAAASFCPPANRIYVLVAAILASSMGFIDGSVLSIATPAIRAEIREVRLVRGPRQLSIADVLQLQHRRAVPAVGQRERGSRLVDLRQNGCVGDDEQLAGLRQHAVFFYQLCY